MSVARRAITSALFASLLGLSCAVQHRPPLVRPVTVARAPAPAPPPPSDSVALIGSSPREWQLVNYTPVAIAPSGESIFGFWLRYERLGLDGRWYEPRTSFCLSGYGGDLDPVAPGVAHPVARPYVMSDDRFAAGTWRAFVTYRDPRHPAFPSRASAVFELAGLDDQPAEQALAVLADREQRHCIDFTNTVTAFVRTAPPRLLPRLLELPAETPGEFETALHAITSVTGDTSVLERAVDQHSPDASLSIALVIARLIRPTEELRDFAVDVMNSRVLAPSAIDLREVDLLWLLHDHWPPAMLPRVLQRLVRDPAPVRAALADMVGSIPADPWRPQLRRILPVVVAASTRDPDPTVRRAFLDAARRLRTELGLAPPYFGAMTESGVDSQGASPAEERCLPTLRALRPMFALASGAAPLAFVLR